MCGITGFISNRGDEPTKNREDILGRMCAVIKYRGPDEQGTVVQGRAALGMRRLSIIDLKCGQQPIYSEDGNLAIVFNGEIYDYIKTKKELESLGHRFKTNSDTEVIVHAFEEFGPACLERLRGMFAFAIWDFRKEELFIARDRVGKKPLFYSLTTAGDFVFGSELKTLLVHGGIDREIDLRALDAYISFGYVPEEFCIFRNVQKLAPGHFLVYKAGQTRTEKYWDFDFAKIEQIKTEGEYIEALRAQIDDAVRVRLISEVPLGAFLSGGVDSATVVSMMSRNSDSPVKTFSIGFNEDSFDELKYARIASKRYETEHHEFIVTPDLTEIMEHLVWHFDEPFSDPSALPTFILSKMAREYVTVVLSGDGGDELFGGYTRYVEDQRRGVFSRLPPFIRKNLLRSFSRFLPHGAPGKNYIYNISLDPIRRYVDSVSQFNGPQKRFLYSKEFQSKLNGRLDESVSDFMSIAESIDTGEAIDRLLYLDSKTYLPSDILTKVDRMTMANSLEARAPLLDHKLIEFVMGVPSNLKIKGIETKYILKKAMEGIVPQEILYREKQGFGVPIREWINAQLRERIHSDLNDSRTLERGYFEKSYIQTLIREHANKRRDHSYQLWLLWMLELWHRKFVDN
ncbi:MAG: asparagine synthase (glutamine-hydrolyzing) [Acidobacteriota bacterium]